MPPHLFGGNWWKLHHKYYYIKQNRQSKLQSLQKRLRCLHSCAKGKGCRFGNTVWQAFLFGWLALLPRLRHCRPGGHSGIGTSATQTQLFTPESAWAVSTADSTMTRARAITDSFFVMISSRSLMNGCPFPKSASGTLFRFS